MRRVAVGFVLGLIAGIAAGWLAAPRSDSPPAGPANRFDGRGDERAAADPAGGAARARVRVNPRSGRARRSRGVQGTGTPSGVVPPTKKGAKSAKAAAEPRREATEATPAEALASLIAIGDGASAGAADELAQRVVRGELVVPWATVLALVRNGHADAARTCVKMWPESDLQRAVEVAADDGHPDAEALREIVGWFAALWMETAYPDARLVTSLSEHADPRVRRASIQLAYGSEPVPFEVLLSLAGDDPDPDVRRIALEFTAWAASESEDPAWLERALPALEHAARSGPLELRRTAIESLPDAGPEAAQVALEILLEEGVEPDLVASLLSAVVNGDRLGALLAAVRTPQQRRNVSSGISEAEIPEEMVRRNARAIAALAPDLDAELASDLYWTIIVVGAHEIVAGAAVSPRLRDDVRERALYVLLDQDEPEIVQASIEAAHSILFGGAGAALRRRVVQSLGEHDWSDRGPGAEAAVIEILGTVAKNDANAWVRGTAAEALSTWEE